jgi:hypothetical protein
LDDHAHLAGPRGTHGAKKKSLNDALDLAAQNRSTSHARLMAVQYARLINLYSGGTVIAPWEVDQLDEEWLDVFLGLMDLPERRKNYQAFENLLAERRKNNPSYRKYLS